MTKLRQLSPSNPILALIDPQLHSTPGYVFFHQINSNGFKSFAMFMAAGFFYLFLQNLIKIFAYGHFIYIIKP